MVNIMSHRILVVDDEPFIRDMIVSFLKEDSAENMVVGEAINGENAYNFLSSHEVDLVITDIKMPVMDGLDLIRKVRVINPRIGFIVLSAYDEFHLVKQAFQIGARDYLLKSEITSEELLDVIDRVSRQMQVENEKTENRDQKVSILGRLLSKNHVFSKEEYSILGLIGDDRFSSFQILVLRLMGENRLKRLDNIPINAGLQLLYDLQTHIEAISNCNILSAVGTDNDMVVLIRYPREASPESRESLPEKIFGEAADYVQSCSGELVGGVSSPSSDPERLCVLYEEAVQAMDYFFVRGRGKLLAYCRVVKEAEKNEPPIDVQERLCKLRKLIQRRNGQQLMEGSASFTVNLFHPSLSDIAAVRVLFQNYHSILQDAMDEEIPEVSEKVRPQLAEFTVVGKEGTLQENNCWIKKTLKTLGTVFNSKSPIVRKTIEYVRANYAKEIKLSEIARQFGVTESYISRAFSKEMHFSFVHYLSKVRVESALELLKTTNLKIYEIAERIGYSNTEHFSRTFKKIIGQSPKEYR